MHNRREAISRELAVLEERRRALTNTQASILSDQEHASDELHLANTRYGEAVQDLERIQSEYEEAKQQLSNAQNSLQSRQSERAAQEEQLADIRAQIEHLSQQRAENNARLDELKSRLELQSQKIEQTKSAIAKGETLAAKTKAQFDSALTKRVNWRILLYRMPKKKSSIRKMKSPQLTASGVKRLKNARKKSQIIRV